MALTPAPWYCNVCELSKVALYDDSQRYGFHNAVVAAQAEHERESPDCESGIRFANPENWYQIVLQRPSTGNKNDPATRHPNLVTLPDAQ